MITKIATCVAVAAACLAAVPVALAQTGSSTVVVHNPPRVNPGDLNWDPQRNVVESEHYDRLLQTSPGFRMARIQKECGPITDPRLRQDCIASFDRYEPPAVAAMPAHRFYGSSTSPRRYQSYYGR